MAFYDSSDALYGTGAYGSASYGIVSPNVALTGVSGTALTRTVHINAFEIDITEPLYGPNALVGSVGTLEFANTVTLAGVAGTGQIGTVSPNIAFSITGVSATGQVNTLTENVTEKVTGVSATGVINGAGLDIRSINRVPVTSPTMTGFIGTPEPRVDETIGIGVQGTTAVGTVQVNISEKLASVSATGSIGALEHSNTVTLTGVEGTGQVGEVEDQPTERIVSGVQATGAIGTVSISNTFSITGVVGTLSVGTLTATGVTFDFEAVKTLYDRRRTAYVEKQLPRIVYIAKQSTAAERRAAA
jgi:hypothetical protein